MQLDIHWRRVHVTPEFYRHIEGRLRIVPSRFGPQEAAWDLYGPRLDPDWRKLEIKSRVQLHHLELMRSCGRSVARSIAKSKATGTSARYRTPGDRVFVTKWGSEGFGDGQSTPAPRLLCPPVQAPPVVSRGIERTNPESHSM